MGTDKKKLDIPGIFRSDADDILKARQDAIRVHKSDIRAAGNEVELSVRNYFKRMLSPKYYVTSEHLIDVNGEVSPQLDLIISDNSNIPSLTTTKDGTEYIPIDSIAQLPAATKKKVACLCEKMKANVTPKGRR